MARILDFYGIRWAYEPHTFPILWNLDGDVVESFSPDFHLADLELYLEMTTLRQKLVRKKNRKLRRLRELYPDVHIKLFYARDFRALMLKYGKLALADGLSGTAGQVGLREPSVGDVAAALVPRVGDVPPALVPALELPEPFVAPPVPAASVPSLTTSARRRRRRRHTAATIIAEPSTEGSLTDR